MKENNSLEKKLKKILNADVTSLKKRNEDVYCETIVASITTLKVK